MEKYNKESKHSTNYQQPGEISLVCILTDCYDPHMNGEYCTKV